MTSPNSVDPGLFERVLRSAAPTAFLEHLQVLMRDPLSDVPHPVYVVDGTTLRLAHERELKRAFPPGRNQHGENHWPTMLLVAFHDVHTGLAMRPSWGAMYGPRPVGEQ